MSHPPGLWHDDHHRYYYQGTGPLPSVTTIVATLDKSNALVGWAKREVAACAVRNHDALDAMIKSGGPEAAADWLARIPDYQRDMAADIGSRVHALAEAISKGQPIAPTPLEDQYVKAYTAFLAKVKPVILMTETSVANLTVGYAGTFDLGCEIDGYPTLLDIKSGKAVYDETALQLAGYAGAEFWATPDDPTPRQLPPWERFGVLHLRPNAWRLIPFDITSDTIDAFDAARQLHVWHKSVSRWSMGTPISEEV